MAIRRDDWLRLGEAHRIIRVAAGEGLAAIAVRTRLTGRQITDMEHGRADPTPILEPLWATLATPPGTERA